MPTAIRPIPAQESSHIPSAWRSPCGGLIRPSGERGERDEAAAIALAIRVQELRGARGAEPRVVDGRRRYAGLAQERLVGRPQVEHHVPVGGGRPPPPPPPPHAAGPAPSTPRPQRPP